MGVGRNILRELRRELPSALGDDLLALLYVGNGLARLEKEFWLVIRPDASMESVRQACLPLWPRHPRALKQGPVVVRPSDLYYYTQLFPGSGRYLRENAALLVGDGQWEGWLGVEPPDSVAALAQLATDIMRCSAFLGSTKPDTKLVGQLMRVARRQAGLELDPGSSPLEMLGALHAHLAARQDDFPEFQWAGPLCSEAPPAYLPGLAALVGLRYDLIIVMPQVDGALLTDIDWTRVRDLISSEFTGLMLATPWQLRLVACVDMAQDRFLRSFEHIWGSDVLADCQVNQYRLMKTAAALPVRVLVEQLPADYITTREENLDVLIHDLQNVLLNIQLRSELMARMTTEACQHPPEPLPGRETPPHQRVAAILNHFRWWADYLVSGWLDAGPSDQG